MAGHMIFIGLEISLCSSSSLDLLHTTHRRVHKNRSFVENWDGNFDFYLSCVRSFVVSVFLILFYSYILYLYYSWSLFRRSSDGKLPNWNFSLLVTGSVCICSGFEKEMFEFGYGDLNWFELQKQKSYFVWRDFRCHFMHLHENDNSSGSWTESSSSRSIAVEFELIDHRWYDMHLFLSPLCISLM